jgi:hypothetical protein
MARLLSVNEELPCDMKEALAALEVAPEPLDKPAERNLLVCCSRPIRDVVIDL